MNRDSQLAETNTAEFEHCDLTQVEKLMAAFDDPRNTAAADLQAYANVGTVSGVVARFIVAATEERDLLLRLIRATLAEQDRLTA